MHKRDIAHFKSEL